MKNLKNNIWLKTYTALEYQASLSMTDVWMVFLCTSSPTNIFSMDSHGGTDPFAFRSAVFVPSSNFFDLGTQDYEKLLSNLYTYKFV